MVDTTDTRCRVCGAPLIKGGDGAPEHEYEITLEMIDAARSGKLPGIAPEMIEAGSDELAALLNGEVFVPGPSDTTRDWAVEVYLAMRNAAA